jgi:hypothetical protein
VPKAPPVEDAVAFIPMALRRFLSCAARPVAFSSSSSSEPSAAFLAFFSSSAFFSSAACFC